MRGKNADNEAKTKIAQRQKERFDRMELEEQILLLNTQIGHLYLVQADLIRRVAELEVA